MSPELVYRTFEDARAADVTNDRVAKNLAIYERDYKMNTAANGAFVSKITPNKLESDIPALPRLPLGSLSS